MAYSTERTSTGGRGPFDLGPSGVIRDSQGIVAYTQQVSSANARANGRGVTTSIRSARLGDNPSFDALVAAMNPIDSSPQSGRNAQSAIVQGTLADVNRMAARATEPAPGGDRALTSAARTASSSTVSSTGNS